MSVYAPSRQSAANFQLLSPLPHTQSTHREKYKTRVRMQTIPSAQQAGM